MVRQNNTAKRFTWVSSSTWVLCGVMALSANAGEFYTIIGPDGRPMVIPRAPAETQKVEVQSKVELSSKQKTEQEKTKVKDAPSAQVVQPMPKVQVVVPPTVVAEKVESQVKTKPQLAEAQKTPIVVQPEMVDQSKSIPPVNNEKKLTSVESQVAVTAKFTEIPKQVNEQPSQHIITLQTPPVELAQSPITQKATSAQVERALHKIETNVAIEKATQLKSKQETSSVSTQSTQEGFLEINGDRYVKNEYLEGKEFNLENKKRFYIMPEGVVDKELGPPRLQVVEREKGVNQGVLDRLFKKHHPVENSVITLSTQYYPIAKDQVVQSLGQSCYRDKKIQKAKLLKAQQDVNLWPRQPLKNHFDYEVVEVQTGIKNVQLSSYASSQNQPSYYWPFVAFLDESGCVIEGVTGFKNQDRAENKYRHAVIDGMLQLPAQTRYIFMTPLLSAVDVEEQALSNQGQIKLTAVR
ncbi:putative pilus assembly protein FilE [Acinetobacter sp. ANC 4910]|uniref:putative pilus assembly protein FilE n=1 Tax=Acinetobacter sp. ANC 4910 TaxID=2529850 RepID=UPI00103FB5E5|nr:putative pilus assembly protein FilE [Acinetobacter sp. ANC 4910]TCB37614.1 putative pilus assembly protein FilE [Acinetobacter sp. ANC 4910]